jgi:hypothetical protein
MSLLETVANDIPQWLRWLRSMRSEKEQRLYRFVLAAIGTMSCIGEPSNGEKLSFQTIECRIGLQQKDDTEYAKHSGVPALDDPDRSNKIRSIVRSMQRKMLLRAHPPDRWSVA